jgi:hypothetical protein
MCTEPLFSRRMERFFHFWDTNHRHPKHTSSNRWPMPEDKDELIIGINSGVWSEMLL